MMVMAKEVDKEDSHSKIAKDRRKKRLRKRAEDKSNLWKALLIEERIEKAAFLIKITLVMSLIN